VLACTVAATTTAGSPRTLDAGPRAAFVPSARPLAVGVVGEIVVAVRTPAAHRVQPIPSPELDGAEIVRVHSEVREHAGGGWLHRTHWRVRPLEPGPLRWPATEVTVVSPSGDETRLALAARVLDVEAVMRPVEEDRAPYGLVELPAAEPGPGFGAGLAAGATATVGLLGLLAGWRRRRTRRAADPAPAPGRAPATTATASDDDPLAQARRALPDDPRRAATLAAAALRAVASERLHVDIRAATTEEIDRTRPVTAPDDVVTELVRLLGRHDATRFPGRPAAPDAVARDVADSAALAARLAGRSERAP
jgi:hypothetical protein